MALKFKLLQPKAVSRLNDCAPNLTIEKGGFSVCKLRMAKRVAGHLGRPKRYRLKPQWLVQTERAYPQVLAYTPSALVTRQAVKR